MIHGFFNAENAEIRRERRGDNIDAPGAAPRTFNRKRWRSHIQSLRSLRASAFSALNPF